MSRAIALLLLAVAAPAHAEEPRPPEPWHASLTVGGSVLATGTAERGALRADASVELLPGGRWDRLGVLMALRALTLDDGPRDALVTAGVSYLAGAARPRLALALYADAGLTLSAPHPAVGGGVRFTSILVGPLAVVTDLGAHLVVGGVDATRLILGASLAVGLAR